MLPQVITTAGLDGSFAGTSFEEDKAVSDVERVRLGPKGRSERGPFGAFLLRLGAKAFLDVAVYVRRAHAPAFPDGEGGDAFLREQLVCEGTPDAEILGELLRA
jgi:hypothetical protein